MRRFFTKRNIIWAVIPLAIIFIGYLILRPKAATYKEAYTVANQDVRQTVIATGTVTSQSDLDLSFKNNGILSRLNVKVGDKVKSGQILASLDEKDAQAVINQANAGLMLAQANYDKLVNGASSPDVQVAKVALNNAKTNYVNTKAQQQVLVNNAHSAMLNSGLATIPTLGNSSTGSVTVSGTYTGNDQGQYLISLTNTGNGLYYQISGLGSSYGYINKGIPISLDTHGLYITFSSAGTFSTSDFWVISIPNTQAINYLTNLNAYQSALQTQALTISTAQGAVDAAQASLDQKIAAPRSEDLESTQAAVAQAQASQQTAQNTYLNNEILSPIDGTITAVNVKIGEQVSAQKIAIVLLDESSLHVETDIPESSINLIKPGQNIDMTLDALGPNRHLSGQVLSIDPASTVISGVIEFRVVSSLPADLAIKPGMTVNLNVVIADKPNTLAIPNRLIKSASDKQIVTTLKQSKTHDVEIKTGLVGDSYTEVTSGLFLGDVLVSSL